MAKKRQKSTTELQQQLEELNARLVGLMNERALLFQQLSATTTDAVLGHSDVPAASPLAARSLQRIFRELDSATLELVAKTRVVYLGPEYSYSHLAAIERFGQGVELVAVGTISAVFEEVAAKQADFGMVPIENSTDGRIVDTIGMFARVQTSICGEVQLRIHHNLLARCARSEVREVYSKPQALSQCRDWLAKHLPQARAVETASTTVAAQIAAQEQNAAAIASRQAGVEYGLRVIAKNIEDNENNITRFAVIGHAPGARTGNDKTSIMFEIHHRPGALADAMAVFKKRKLNMTWIESFPMPGTKSEYLFFVELEGHHESAQVRRALKELTEHTVKLSILGSYAKSEPVE